MIGKAPRKKKTKKPSSQKRTGKAVASPRSKARKASTRLKGTETRKAISAIDKKNKALKEAYKKS